MESFVMTARNFFLTLLMFVCVGWMVTASDAGAVQTPVNVCPSCNGWARMGGTRCLQCQGAGIVRADGSMINGIRGGAVGYAGSIAVYVCPSCGGVRQVPCVQCRGTGMVRADGSMINGVNTGLRAGLTSGKPSKRIVVCPYCDGRSGRGMMCLNCRGRGIVPER